MAFKFDGLLKKSTELISNTKFTENEFFSIMDQNEILQWLDEVKFASSKIYDQAMDAEYLATKNGGGNHRLFDGGHSLTDAWEKVREANPDDTFLQEVIGYMKALWNDASTIKGLPFQTLEKSSYEDWVKSVSSVLPGVSKEWLYDLTSFDACELTSAATGLATAIFQLKNEDYNKFDQLIGSMGVSSIMGANPIMGIFVIGLAGYSYAYKKNELDKKTMGKAAAATAFSSIVFMVLGLPFFIELIVVIVASSYFKKKVLNDDELLEKIKYQFISNFSSSTANISAWIKKQTG